MGKYVCGRILNSTKLMGQKPTLFFLKLNVLCIILQIASAESRPGNELGKQAGSSKARKTMKLIYNENLTQINVIAL